MISFLVTFYLQRKTVHSVTILVVSSAFVTRLVASLSLFVLAHQTSGRFQYSNQFEFLSSQLSFKYIKNEKTVSSELLVHLLINRLLELMKIVGVCASCITQKCEIILVFAIGSLIGFICISTAFMK